ncbi:MAG: hypothetical protein AB1458_01530 [Bacteroidota bacterium]
MNRTARILLLWLIPGTCAISDARHVYHQAFYRYQVSFYLGLGKNSAPGTSFPFCYSLGGSLRYRQHMLGARRDHFSRLVIFSEATRYDFINAYYGYSLAQKNTSASLQLGLGLFETNYRAEGSYSGAAAELSLELLLHARGNGIGARIFYNYNGRMNYAGIMILANLGWAWKKGCAPRINQ